MKEHIVQVFIGLIYSPCKDTLSNFLEKIKEGIVPDDVSGQG